MRGFPSGPGEARHGETRPLQCERLGRASSQGQALALQGRLAVTSPLFILLLGQPPTFSFFSALHSHMNTSFRLTFLPAEGEGMGSSPGGLPWAVQAFPVEEQGRTSAVNALPSRLMRTYRYFLLPRKC